MHAWERSAMASWGVRRWGVDEGGRAESMVSVRLREEKTFPLLMDSPTMIAVFVTVR